MKLLEDMDSRDTRSTTQLHLQAGPFELPSTFRKVAAMGRRTFVSVQQLYDDPTTVLV